MHDRIEIAVTDITTLSVDAIVNAANHSLLGGGGVDGAIHRAAGPRLRAHNATLNGCATGKSVVTPAFDLEARGIRHIIHTVGPVWGTDPHAEGDEELGYRLEDHQLARCYQSCLEAAEQLDVETLAFPAISTGVYGFPKVRAAKIALGHVRAALGRIQRPRIVVFACFSDQDAATYRELMGEVAPLIQLGGTGSRRSLTDVEEK
ncbi:MAG: macro domain-containing protein [Myxococcota bacterium]